VIGGSVGVRAVASQPLDGAGHVHAWPGGRVALPCAGCEVVVAEWRSVGRRHRRRNRRSVAVQRPYRARPTERAPVVTLTLSNVYTHTHTHTHIHHYCTIIILSRIQPRAHPSTTPERVVAVVVTLLNFGIFFPPSRTDHGDQITNRVLFFKSVFARLFFFISITLYHSVRRR